MGRTLPTFNLYLEQEMELWRPFRRALRKEDQALFDLLFAMAKRHMAEAAYVARPVPFDTLVLSVLLEQQKCIERLKTLLDKKDKEVKDPVFTEKTSCRDAEGIRSREKS